MKEIRVHAKPKETEYFEIDVTNMTARQISEQLNFFSLLFQALDEEKFSVDDKYTSHAFAKVDFDLVDKCWGSIIYKTKTKEMGKQAFPTGWEQVDKSVVAIEASTDFVKDMQSGITIKEHRRRNEERFVKEYEEYMARKVVQHDT